jgi:hypothetical protein
MQQQQPTQVNSTSFFWKGGDSGWAVIPAGSRPAATSFAPKAAF